jgi:hypothetical protein
MRYAEFQARDRFDTAELLAFGRRRARRRARGLRRAAPAAPLLMMDRIVEIGRTALVAASSPSET